MALTNVQMMNMIGIQPAANRNAIIADLLSEGLNGLTHMTDEEVRETLCVVYEEDRCAFPSGPNPCSEAKD